MRFRKTLIALVAVPLTIMLVVFVVAETPWGHERARRVVVSQVNKRIFGELTVGDLGGNLLTGVTLKDVRLTDSARNVLFSAKAVDVHYNLISALQRRVVINALTLDTAFVLLDKRPGARWNFQAIVRSSGTAKDTTRKSVPPVLDNITLHRSRFLYRRPWVPDSTLPIAKQQEAIAAALSDSARRRTERVPGGFQRVLDYHEIDARLPTVTVGQPIIVEIGALAMLAEPYRPPAIDIRSLAGTLYASKDSLWWHGAKMSLPGSKVSGDGKIGFRKSGFTLDLTGAPLALADLRWLNTRIPDNGGGTLRYRMNLHGDTADFAIHNTDLKFQGASLTGDAAVAMVKPPKGTSTLLVRGADLTVAQLDTKTIHALAPTLQLARSGIIDGHFVVTGSATDANLKANVEFADAQSGRSKLTAEGGVGFTNGLAVRQLKVHAFPVQVATVVGAKSRIPIGGTVTGDVTINGSTHTGWSARGDVTHIDNANRSRIIGTGTYRATGKDFAIDAALEPLSLVTIGSFAKSAELHGDVTGHIHATGTTHDVRFRAALKSRDGGNVDAHGTVALAGANSRYDVTILPDALNARAFSSRAPITSLTGTIAAKGTGYSAEHANASFVVDLARSRYDTFAVDAIHSRGAVTAGLLSLDSLSASIPEAHLTAHGTLGLIASRRGTLDFGLVADSLGALRHRIGSADSTVVAVAQGRQTALLVAARKDSARRAEAIRIEQLALGLPTGVALIVDTIPGIKRDSLAGSAAVTGILSGNIKELGIEATIRGSHLVARGNSIRRMSGKLFTRNVRDTQQPLTFDFSADTIEASGMSINAVRTAGTWQNDRLAASIRVLEDSLVSYALLGSYSHPAKNEHIVRIDSLSARVDSLVWRLTKPADVRVLAKNIIVDSLDLRSSNDGRLFANGRLPSDGAIHLNIAAENVRVSTVLRALQRDAAAGDGLLSLAADVGGTRLSPWMNGGVLLRNARYKDVRAPDADLKITFHDRYAFLDLLVQDSVRKHLLTAIAQAPFDARMASVSGSRRDSNLPVGADVVLDSFALAALPLDLNGFDDIHGMLGGNAHVRGTWKKLNYSGVGALRNAGVTVASTGMKLERANADIRFSGDSVVLDSLVAFAGGALRAGGSVDLRDMKHPFVRMTVAGNDLRVFNSIRGLVDADANVGILGPLDELRVTGHGEMKGGYLALKQFPKDLLRVKAPGTLSFFTVLDTSTTASEKLRAAAVRALPKRVAIIADLSLVADRGSFYRSRPDGNTEFYTGPTQEIRAHLDQRSGDQWAVGFVNIGDGSLFFRTRAFVPARGTMTLVPVTDAVGLLQQVGERIVWEPGRGLFPLDFLTGGTSRAPSVGLESGSLFPIRGRELNGYLTMGRQTTSVLQQSGSSLSGSEAWSGQLSGESGMLARRQQGATALGVVLHDIGTGFTKEYGFDAFGVAPADVPTELVFGKTGGVRGALMEGGRYITTDLYLAGQLRFTSGIPGLRMAKNFGTSYLLNVGLEPRFLFDGVEELGITHPTKRSGAFGVLLSRMWDF